ncbi:unnamed protein product [Mycena citricolor]|uniref:BTB domain-containing protein n=1 Tax=Mycena citricolor TaxID=2018698 RepID=A0AAD2HF82_9AGAR|nr:unnamed protein product [Mycena citricolor]
MHSPAIILQTANTRRSRAVKEESAARARAVSMKRRAPLGVKLDVNVDAVPIASSSKITLPCSLLCPVSDDVPRAPLVAAYPQLEKVPTQYIRDRLPLTSLCAAVRAVETSVSRSSLPKEVRIPKNRDIEAACPTHMLAVHGGSLRGQTCPVSLYPVHHIVFASHCAHMPSMPPPPSDDPSAAHVVLPVVPFKVPSPETFSALYAYLYTKQVSALVTQLSPPCSSDLLLLFAHAGKIHGLWQNACALGVVDQILYRVIQVSWSRTLAAMHTCAS